MILREIAIAPKDLSIKFDLALAKQQYASILNDQPKEKRPLEALKVALSGLLEAQKSFAEIMNIKPGPGLGFDPEHAKTRSEYCNAIKRICEKKIHETQVLERQREERLIEMKKKQEEDEIEKKAKEQAAEDERKKQQEIIEQQRKELKEKMKSDNEKMKQTEDEAKANKGKRIKEESDSEEDRRRYFVLIFDRNAYSNHWKKNQSSCLLACKRAEKERRRLNKKIQKSRTLTRNYKLSDGPRPTKASNPIFQPLLLRVMMRMNKCISSAVLDFAVIGYRDAFFESNRPAMSVFGEDSWIEPE